MAEVRIDKERCKGCGLCTTVCPKEIMVLAEEINSRGYHPAHVDDIEQCTGCASCARICPDVAIEVFR